MSRHIVDAKETEFLSSSKGLSNGEVVGLITCRLITGKFMPTSLLLSKEQIVRLRDDLNRNFPRTEYPATHWDG